MDNVLLEPDKLEALVVAVPRCAICPYEIETQNSKAKSKKACFKKRVFVNAGRKI
ncbi:MAG: hypothetical protein O9326_21775 [Microcystis sp. LE19-338.1B]|nr:hypothetical protein [Microcystis sp. LE19-338.1B]